MEDNHDESPAIVSDFPLPPAYYLNYGPNGTNPLPPPEPPPPANGEFSVFGEDRKLDEQTPTLEAQGLKTLYDVNGNAKEQLKKLVNESKKKFAALLYSLANDAPQETVNEQFEALDLYFINMLYMVNEMRAVQAMAELRNLMKTQIKAKQETIALLEATVKKTDENVARAFIANAINESTGDVPMSDDKAKDSEKAVTEESIRAFVEEEFLKFKKGGRDTTMSG